MRTSDLSHRVVIQRATEARDTFGDPVKTWTVLAQVWAKIEWAGGGETFQGDRDFEEVNAIVTIRRSSDTMSVRAKDRILVPQGYTTLSEAITAAETAVDVVDAGVFPPENGFCVRMRSELGLVTSVATNTLTMTRGAFSTTAAVHPPDTTVNMLAPVDVVRVAHQRHSITIGCVRSEVRLVA